MESPSRIFVLYRRFGLVEDFVALDAVIKLDVHAGQRGRQRQRISLIVALFEAQDVEFFELDFQRY